MSASQGFEADPPINMSAEPRSPADRVLALIASRPLTADVKAERRSACVRDAQTQDKGEPISSIAFMACYSSPVLPARLTRRRQLKNPKPQ